MELNNNDIILCFLLWIFTELSAIAISIYKRAKNKRSLYIKKLYVQRLIYYTKKRKLTIQLLQEMYFSLGHVKELKSIILEALKLGDIRVSLEYIEDEIGFETMYLLHDRLLENIPVDDNFCKKLNESMLLWEKDNKDLQKIFNKGLIKASLEKNVVLLINVALYLQNKTVISRGIYIVVNTIGVIIFIVLLSESIVVDDKIRDGKLARKYSHKNKTLAAFQTVAGLGLILNISMLAAKILERAV